MCGLIRYAWSNAWGPLPYEPRTSRRCMQAACMARLACSVQMTLSTPHPAKQLDLPHMLRACRIYILHVVREPSFWKTWSFLVTGGGGKQRGGGGRTHEKHCQPAPKLAGKYSRSGRERCRQHDTDNTIVSHGCSGFQLSRARPLHCSRTQCLRSEKLQQSSIRRHVSHSITIFRSCHSLFLGPACCRISKRVRHPIFGTASRLIALAQKAVGTAAWKDCAGANPATFTCLPTHQP